jgi:hypothetical protein
MWVRTALQLEVSITTRFPTLMAVGLDAVATYNETKAPEVLKGFYKYLPKRQYPLGTVVSPACICMCADAGLASSTCYGK